MFLLGNIIQIEKENKSKQKTILVLLKKADKNCFPVDMENYSASHFI